jgi:hypothetical protein
MFKKALFQGPNIKPPPSSSEWYDDRITPTSMTQGVYTPTVHFQEHVVNGPTRMYKRTRGPVAPLKPSNTK